MPELCTRNLKHDRFYWGDVDLDVLRVDVAFGQVSFLLEIRERDALTLLGVVVEILEFLLPWSLGWRSGVDPLLARTLFWFTGHALVYFWLLPAYVSWYALLPYQAGGRLVSDTAARVSFLLFLLFSIPVGLHHQVTDPGIPRLWKAAQMTMTFLVITPSLVTAFTVAASLETAGRARGGRGWLGWLTHLPWGDPSVAAQVLAMFTFIFGGATGIVLASIMINPMLHDTVFIPGHFHLTVGTATTLSALGILLWLIPHLAQRRLFSRRLALTSVWLWAIGMLGIGLGLMWQGTDGTPRRDWISALDPDPYHHGLPMAITAVAGVLLLLSVLGYLLVMLGTLASPRVAAADAPELPLPPPDARPRGEFAALLDRLGLWTLAAAALTAAVYLPLLVELFQHQVPVPGNTLW